MYGHIGVFVSFAYLICSAFSCTATTLPARFVRGPKPSMKIWSVNKAFCFDIDNGFKKFNFKQIMKVSAFYLEKQKSFIPKKI